MTIDFDLVNGCVLGIEHLNNPDPEDEDAPPWIIVINLLVVRLLVYS